MTSMSKGIKGWRAGSAAKSMLALVQDLGLLPSTHISWFTTACNSSSPLFWSLHHMVHIQKLSHIHINTTWKPATFKKESVLSQLMIKILSKTKYCMVKTKTRSGQQHYISIQKAPGTPWVGATATNMASPTSQNERASW